MKTQHTRGPWEISGGALRIFSEATHEPVAFALQCNPQDGLSPTPAVAIANARLIAAGPELLAALREIVARWDSLTDQPVPEEINDNDLWDAAHAAIAKAEGAQ